MKRRYKSHCAKKSWMLRDRAEKMEALYGCPLDLPENDLKPKPGIVQSLVFSALLVGLCALIYFIVKS